MTRPIPELSGDPERDLETLRACVISSALEQSGQLCMSLAKIDIAAAGDALRELAGHPDEHIRASAVAAFDLRISEKETVRRLRFALGDARAPVVAAAVQLVGEHRLAEYRNELRALAAMPNEAASDPWLSIANEALAILASFCSTEDLDLGTRAFADPKLERGGSLLLDALVRHAPLDSLLPFLSGQHELCVQLFAGLSQPDGESRLGELSECEDPLIASLAQDYLEAWQQRSLPPLLAVDARLPLNEVPVQAEDHRATTRHCFSKNAEFNQRLSALLDDACRAHEHAGSDSQGAILTGYAEKLCVELRANPWLAKRLFALKNRVIARLTYRAIQYRDSSLRDDR